ncbi:FecR family protein [Novosphingobium decolorationis]|uniref:FecR domain-containing protein n=1 Tax=Novosphingobium decolorationis TaxID=2698673 RepID=A0ABX8E7G6_9SPHN|nr:FecR domain-containing protein [Novosphingobium decolorationis]QVM84880.1 FecR domain-containing protein [Novosphingobium decolorationis]
MTPPDDALPDDEDEAAALWVARHLSHAVDTTAFAAWLSGAPDRRARFEALWATCMDEAVTDGLRLHAETAPRPAGNDNAGTAPRASRRRALGLAAGGALLVGALALGLPQLRFQLTPENSWSTGPGEVRAITLADGSQVHLNGNSRLFARIGETRREVRLETGEALFDVTHDPARPFTVSAQDSTVTVLGTRFDVALNGEAVDLQVERGLVRFAANAPGIAPVRVPAGHTTRLADGVIAPLARIRGEDAESWRSGWLQVRDMPLDELVPQLERWTDRQILVEDPALLRTRVAGRLHLAEPVTVLENLGLLHGFSVKDTGHALVLDRI